jgi:hypothetical protein
MLSSMHVTLRPKVVLLVLSCAISAACAGHALQPGSSARGGSADSEIRRALQGMVEGWNRAHLDVHVAPCLHSASFMTGTGQVCARCACVP